MRLFKIVDRRGNAELGGGERFGLGWLAGG